MKYLIYILSKLAKTQRRISGKWRSLYYSYQFKSCGKIRPKNSKVFSFPANISCGDGLIIN